MYLNYAYSFLTQYNNIKFRLVKNVICRYPFPTNQIIARNIQPEKILSDI